ncbi:MAG: DNA-binding protein WhiA [Oscillospiraceae bacterium]|nr:DNA-binding protein WhiA [Oscillospiraceae bacterium]
MTFSSAVKIELCKLPVGKRCCAVAEVYGAFLYGNTFAPGEIKLVTESGAFGARLGALTHRAFGVGFDVLPREGTAGKQSYIVNDPVKLAKIADAVGYDRAAHLSHQVNLGLLEEPCCHAAFVRGAFLAGGSVTDPERGYHLELVTGHMRVSAGMVSILRDMHFDPKDTMRRGNWAVYFKQSGAIEDFLTTIGASGSALHYMTAKVERDMRNAIQRKVNCDAANVDKSVEAASAQIAAIRRIEQRIGLESLPEKLHQTALLRIVNPELSLAELAQLADPPVTKSCMSHRLRKLMELGAVGADAHIGPSSE